MPFFNPFLLWLIIPAIGVPVLAHLLSRRNFDVVEWGAMQFLQADRQMRRRLLLEELLLLMLRILLAAMAVAMLSRPWVQGGWLADLLARPRRDIAVVLDGSYSMGWEGGAKKPFEAARDWTRQLIDRIGPGDTITLIDARDRPRTLTPGPVSDRALVRQLLEDLPPPSGSSDLMQALASGIRSLSSGKNPVREVIVVTDGQARCWSPDDAGRLDLIRDLLEHQQVKPRLWVADVTAGGDGDRTNFALQPLTPSRELTVSDLPVRFRTKLKYTGGRTPLQRKVHFEVDGQRLADSAVQTPLLSAGGEFTLEFEHRFTQPGSHLVTASVDADNLPGDNAASAAVTLAGALPALLIDGATHRDPTRRESFFVNAALSARDNSAPFVKAAVVNANDWQISQLAGQTAVLLLNVQRLTDVQADAISRYVADGGGLIVAPGDQLDGAAFNRLWYGRGDRLLPASFGKTLADETKPPAPGIRIQDSSLALPFLQGLRREEKGDFTEARFSKWQQLTPAPDRVAADELDPAEGRPAASPPIVAARLSNGAPFLVLRNYGRGRVALLASPLDSDWSTLPARADFVVFVHQLIFHVAGGAAPARNVFVGDPLVLAVPKGTQSADYVFAGPPPWTGEPQLSGDETHPLLRLDQAPLPGVFTLQAKQKGPRTLGPEHFVVNFDRGESDLTPLTKEQRERMTAQSDIRFIREPGEIAVARVAGSPPIELWHWFAAALLLLLTAEIAVTALLMRSHQPSAESAT